MYIKIILFLFLFQKIYSIPQTDSEAFVVGSGSYDNSGIDFNNICPCHKTDGVCEKGCCCDKECLVYMLDHNYYEQYSECDPDSYLNRRTYSKLDYCDGYKKSIDDLYNPLVLAFKILKMGFCLYKTREDENDDDNENEKEYEKLKQKLESVEKTDKSELLEGYEYINPSDWDFNPKDIKEYMHFNVPITLPSGLCFLGNHQIKQFQDYEVTCSYDTDKEKKFNNTITENFKPSDEKYYNVYYILDNYYYNISSENDPNTIKSDYEINMSTNIDSSYSSNIRNLNDIHLEELIIKKVEIFYYNDNKYIINHYFDENKGKYQDFTLDIKFLKDEKDYQRSGNPGYIKGKPILIGKKEENHYLKYRNDITLKLETGDNCEVKSFDAFNFYFDNYMDNKLTFDDYIFYGYKNKSCYRNILNYYFKNDEGFGRFGNANIKYIKDWDTISPSSSIETNYNPFLIMGVYRDTGATNNTQFQLINFEVNQQNTESSDKYLYFVVKLLKLKNVKTKWWEAPGPGFIRLPRNIMYPFRIGTTNYKR